MIKILLWSISLLVFTVSGSFAEPPNDKCPKGKWQYDTDQYGVPMCTEHGNRPITIPTDDHPKAERPRYNSPAPVPSNPPGWEQPKSMDVEGFKFSHPPKRRKSESQKERERNERVEEAIRRSRERERSGSAFCFIGSLIN